MKSKVIASVLICLMLVLNRFFPYPVYAGDYVVSGNGEGSSNSVNVQEGNSSTTAQSNDSEISNEVQSDSNTGENEASGNTGETSIQTGDSSSGIIVENSGNTNTASVDCCPSDQESSAIVAGNGSDSNNQINHTQTADTAASQNNQARIKNNIRINADTGGNEAGDNNGDVSIVTGQVNISAGVLNNLNSSYISSVTPDKSFNSKIAGNGSGSSNEVDSEIFSNQDFFVNNYLELDNNIKTFANTGGNKVNKNSGTVFIFTGSIYLDLLILNKGNISKVITDYGCKEKPSPVPTPKPSESPSPTTPPSDECCSPTNNPPGGGGGPGESGSSGGSSGGSSEGGGKVLGTVLPATGGFSVFQATMLALLMLSSGVILRLDYGKTKKQLQKVKIKASIPFFFHYAQISGQFINWKCPYPVPRYLFAYYQVLPPPPLLF